MDINKDKEIKAWHAEWLASHKDTRFRVTERGKLITYFSGSKRCLYRRNTLLEFRDIKLVISTLGNLTDLDNKLVCISGKSYYETRVFHALTDIKRNSYRDIDPERKVKVNTITKINKPDSDIKADQMHEKVIKELTYRLDKGDLLDGHGIPTCEHNWEDTGYVFHNTTGTDWVICFICTKCRKAERGVDVSQLSKRS